MFTMSRLSSTFFLCLLCSFFKEEGEGREERGGEERRRGGEREDTSIDEANLHSNLLHVLESLGLGVPCTSTPLMLIK